MNQDNFMNRKHSWGITALIVFVMAAGGFIYYQLSEVQQFKKQAAQEIAEAEELLRQSEKSKKVSKIDKKAEQATSVTPAESETPTAEKPIIIGEGTETNTDKTSKTVTIATPEQDNTEEVRVSAHGFGPYPEVPEDFPENVNWSNYEVDHPIYELMTRVQIKLWKQGHRVEGITTDGELLYPIIRGIVYVRWSGDDKYIGGATGHPSDLSEDVIEQIESGTIPAGLTVYEKDKVGIDPYKFLNLQRVPGN